MQSVKNLSVKQLRRRIYEISYKNKLSHIGSCISCVSIIDRIYKKKKEHETFCLGSSHAALALYVILEKFYGFDANDLYKRHGTHANRSLEDKIYVTGGSLGLVETIALGIAVAKPNERVFLLSSDGATTEGVIWETLRFKSDNNINNLKWFINCNSLGAYSYIDTDILEERVHCFDKSVKIVRTSNKLPFCEGLNSHYHIMSEEDYQKIK